MQATPDDNPLLGLALFRRIWGLAWPLIVANAMELVVGLIDLWLVRDFGPAATAAVGLGRQVIFLVEALAVTITSGALTLISQGVGARNRSSSSKGPVGRHFDPDEVVRQSLGLAVLLGFPVTLAGYLLTGPLLAALQVTAETRTFGEPYLRIYFTGILFFWGYQVGAALFRGSGDVWTPLKIAAGVSLLQVALNYVFIHGAGPVPAFEVQGAALGAVLARVCGVLVFLILLLWGRSRVRLCLPAGGQGVDWALIRYLLSVGVPMALANVFRHGSRVVFLAIAGTSALGMSLQAAIGVALQVRLLGVLVALAFQTATATLVGQAVGRGDDVQAEATGRRSVQLLALVMGTISAGLMLVSEPLAELFIDAPEVATLAAQVMRWFAVAQFFSALSIGTQGALLGAGDTLPALRYTIVSEWCLMLPVAYLLVRLDGEPDGLLAVWVMAPALTLVLMLRRWHSGCWKRVP